MNKSEIRKKIFKLRKKNYFKYLSINSSKLLKFLESKKIKNKIIGGYYPYNYEVDTLDILKKLEKNNYLISLPKINKNKKMDFYKWSFKDPLSINIYGIPEPFSKKKLTMKKGQILIRKHNLWHRGTKNFSNKPRLLLSFIITLKNKKNRIDQVNSKFKILHNSFRNDLTGRLHEIIYAKFNYMVIIIKLFLSFLKK